MHTGISQTQIGTNAFLKSRAAAAADEAQTASAAHPEVSEQGASLLDTVLQRDPASRPTATALVAFLGAAAVESAGDDDGRLREALAAKDAALVEKDAALTTVAAKDAALAKKDASLVEKEVALTTALTTVAAKDAALAEKDASLDNKEAALAAALAEMEQLRALMPLPVPALLDMQSSSAVFSRIVQETGTTGFGVAWGDFEHAFASLYFGAVSSSPDVAVIARLRMDMNANGDGFINRAEWAHWHQRWMAAGAPPMAEYIGGVGPYWPVPAEWGRPNSSSTAR